MWWKNEINCCCFMCQSVMGLTRCYKTAVFYIVNWHQYSRPTPILDTQESIRTVKKLDSYSPVLTSLSAQIVTSDALIWNWRYLKWRDGQISGINSSFRFVDVRDMHVYCEVEFVVFNGYWIWSQCIIRCVSSDTRGNMEEPQEQWAATRTLGWQLYCCKWYLQLRRNQANDEKIYAEGRA